MAQELSPLTHELSKHWSRVWQHTARNQPDLLEKPRLQEPPLVVRGMCARCVPRSSQPCVTMNDLFMKVIVFVLISPTRLVVTDEEDKIHDDWIQIPGLQHSVLLRDGWWLCCYRVRNKKTNGMLLLGLKQTKSQCGEPQWEIEC